MKSPTLASEEGTAALNQGLDTMIKAHKEVDALHGTPLSARAEQGLTQQVFSPNEIASMLVLAVRRLAVLP
jgi:hypothetical protein